MNVGIIGCGKQAEKHINGYRAHGIEDIFVTDISPEAVKKLSADMNVKGVDTLDALLTNPAISMLDICTPTPSHAQLIEAAINSGKDFLVEKPLCEDFKQAQNLQAKIAEKNCIGAVGFTYRFAPSLVKIKDILLDEQAPLGDIISATFRIGGRGSHASWKHLIERGGGAIQEMAIHMIDLAVWYFGPMAKVDLVHCDLKHPQRQIGGTIHDVDAEDDVIIKLTSQQGVNIAIIADFTTPSFTQYAEIQGRNGMAFGSIQPSFAPFIAINQPVGSYEKGHQALDIQPTNIVADLIGDFVNSVQKKKQARGTIEDSVEVQRISDLLLNKARS